MQVLFSFFFLVFSTFAVASPTFFPAISCPEGWEIAHHSKLEEGVKIGFVQSRKKFFTPSITLTIEPIGDSELHTYIKAVKNHYTQDHTNTYRNLGTLHTSIGSTPLIQIDMKNQWGEIRVLQAISMYGSYALIQTGVCLKKDFLKVHETFLSAFKSLTVSSSIFDSIDDPDFKNKTESLLSHWNTYIQDSKHDRATLLTSPYFQETLWKPYVDYVENQLVNKGSSWQFLALRHIQESLFKVPK